MPTEGKQEGNPLLSLFVMMIVLREALSEQRDLEDSRKVVRKRRRKLS
jgi:hypothetical protein